VQFENGFKAMVFEHGLRCWNGPERSARVELECGVENEVVKVMEPSKCEYIIKMRTPAVCVRPEKGVVREHL
jgi:protein kinase C substrate 80K-H